jgi:predicted GH43/DUF377 family glycosyl hydrolase
MPNPVAKLGLCCLFAALITGMIVLPTVRGSNAVQGRVVINIGGGGAWDGYSVFKPFVLYNGSSYMMWYSGESVYVIDYIGFAKSTDGVTWSRYSQNPVLNVGDVGTWDHGRVNDAWVIHENGIYKMWYTGVLYMAFTKLIVEEQIGYATSPDGLNWTKYAGNPVLRYGPTGSLNDKWVFRPVVLSTGSSYTMYYGSLSQTDTYGIGMATSKDGISWTKLSPLTIPSSGWDTYAPSIGSITKIENTLVMAYAGQTSQPSPPQIGLANSTDGTSWTAFPKNPVITGGGGSSWDNAGVSDPMIVNVGDHYSVYYTGSASNGTSRIGFATLPKTQISIPELSPSIFVAVAGITLTAFNLLQLRIGRLKRNPGS